MSQKCQERSFGATAFRSGRKSGSKFFGADSGPKGLCCCERELVAAQLGDAKAFYADIELVDGAVVVDRDPSWSSVKNVSGRLD